ncbi:MAG TPA: hypothetical protein VKA21_12250 [Candidatus Binatia bacterium]|nr:hypothetical protein [Candidatus Binatia bacterium]
MKTFAWTPAAVALLIASSVRPSGALEVHGGRNPATDCYARLDVGGTSAGNAANAVGCADGDPTCDQDGTADGTCTVALRLCLNRPGDPKCTPPAGGLRKVKPKGILQRLALPVPDLASSACGDSIAGLAVPVGRRGMKPGKRKVRVVAVGPRRSDRDVDTVRLVCRPSCDPAEAPRACPSNPRGPNRVVLTVRSEGSDLDNGWKGPSFNFPTPDGTTFEVCLGDCNDGAGAAPDPECATRVLTGDATFNGRYFGPPLPLFAADVPVCVVNEYQPSQACIGGTANVETGTIDGEIRLFSRVFLTEEQFVCPKCLDGRCNDGPRAGQPCTVHGTTTVPRSTAADKTFPLSKDCPPFANSAAGVLDIRLPLTTGTARLEPLAGVPGATDRTPCGKLPNEALVPAPDSCGSAGTCTDGCAGPETCARLGSDPVTGASVCVDAKGGLSQHCCSGVPCHPTRGGERISRVGTAEPPVDAGGHGWGSGTYPKSSNLVHVATFCERATGTASVDGLTGLPGPGALVLPSSAVWSADDE